MSGSTIAIIIIIVALLVILFTSYVKSPPDKAYIISGLRKTPKILIGKAGLKLPFFERKDELLIKQISIDIKTDDYVPTLDFIGVNIDAVAKVKIRTDEEGMQLAMKNFLNMKEPQIMEALVDSLQGNMREIIGTISLKELCNDRKSFGDQVQEKAQVARTFMIKPMGPVWLMVSISMKATRIEMMAAAKGPKVKPPMQTTTSLKSKSKNMTLGISLDRSITM